MSSWFLNRFTFVSPAYKKKILLSRVIRGIQSELVEFTFGPRLIGQDQNLMLSEGFISLQAESHSMEFRKVELLELEEK
jgi:hypothetical protein